MPRRPRDDTDPEAAAAAAAAEIKLRAWPTILKFIQQKAWLYLHDGCVELMFANVVVDCALACSQQHVVRQQQAYPYTRKDVMSSHSTSVEQRTVLHGLHCGLYRIHT